jgi:hypothetical protein
VALHLGVAKNAIFLDGLPEARQEVVLRLAFPKLDKHKGILPHAASGSCVAGRSRGVGGLCLGLPAVARRRVLGEAGATVDRAVASRLKGDLSLLAAVGADRLVHLTLRRAVAAAPP